MKDIHVHLNGTNGTMLDLLNTVEGKSLCEQKCLINIATFNGTDPIYPTRGTNLLTGAIQGLAAGLNEASHLGNFAALDTLFFVREQEYATQAGSPDLVEGLTLTISDYTAEPPTLHYTAQFNFADGTTNATISTVQ